MAKTFFIFMSFKSVALLTILSAYVISSTSSYKVRDRFETNIDRTFTNDEILKFEKQLNRIHVKGPLDPPSAPDTPAPPTLPPPSLENVLNADKTFAQLTNDVIPAYIKQTRTCSDLTFYVRLLIDRIRTGGTLQEVEILFQGVCTAGRQPLAVCAGLSKRLVPPLYFIAKERSDLTPEIFVGVVFQHVGCPTNDRYIEWEVNDPDTDRVSNTTGSSSETIAVEGEGDGKGEEEGLQVKCRRGPKRPLKILHMTDIHVDPLYKNGTNAACENKIMCCHDTDGEPANSSVTAGPYGSGLNCDIPLRTLESALKNVQEVHPDVDLFYMSGDLVPHNLWYTNRQDNLDTIKLVSDTIRAYFPNTTIVPILGNHEPHPVNMFSPVKVPDELSTRYIFNGTYESWLDWIPPEAAEEYQRTGHYSVTIWKGFRILVLNTNLCFGFNFWQLYSFNDFKEQLRWLQSELEKSMELNEKVHIVGHVPPGYLGCSKVFSRNYYKIVANYSSVVRAQFFGHLHVDTFRIYFNPQNKKIPATTQWISPSLTPYHINNPAYKIFYAHPDTLDILNYETYILNLKDANEFANNNAMMMASDSGNSSASRVTTEPTWYKLYSATEAYNVPNLSVDNLARVVDGLAKNETLFKQYYKYYVKAANSNQTQTCEGYCRKRFLCRLVRPYFGVDEECNDIQLKVDGSVVPIYDSYSIF